VVAPLAGVEVDHAVFGGDVARWPTDVVLSNHRPPADVIQRFGHRVCAVLFFEAVGEL